MNLFKDLIENQELRPVSWFRPAPTSWLTENVEREDFSVDTCLKCGFSAKLIFQCDGMFLTCIRCGWIEPFEDLNDVEFGTEIKAEIFNQDAGAEHRTNGFTIAFAREAGCSGFKNMRPDEVEVVKQTCPHCNSKWTKKYGTFRNRHHVLQRFHCLACSGYFSDGAPPIIVNNVSYRIKTRISPKEAVAIIEHSMNGFGVRQIQRKSGLHSNTISRILKQVRATTELFCKCGKPFGVKHFCDHILKNSPRRLQYLKAISPAKYGNFVLDTAQPQHSLAPSGVRGE